MRVATEAHTQDIHSPPKYAGLLLAAFLLLGCAGPARDFDGTAHQEQPQAERRTLTVAFRYEPTDLSPKTSAQGGGDALDSLFNALLTSRDVYGVDQPVLLESLPQLNTETWRVSPDGRMETTYRLRPGLTWHDGEPLGSDDFVFAWRVYTDSSLGAFTAKPQDQMESVTPGDPTTFVIRWRSLYADADVLGIAFPPLPSHILTQPYAASAQDASHRDAFVNHSYWTTDYVGLGPYRLEQWEAGSTLAGVAFPGYVLGSPRIPRIVARIFADESTVLANILAGTVDFAANLALRFEHAITLKREWAAANRGILVFTSGGTPHHQLFQFRPEFQKTTTLFDVRVRRAFAHSIDKQALLDGLFDGEGITANTSAPTDEPFFAEVERVVTRYPFDPRRVEALMNDAGFRKDAGGVYADGSGERFRPDFTTLTGTVFERGHAIMLDTWSRVGIEVNPTILPAAQVRNSEVRSTFSGLMQAGGTEFGAGSGFTTSSIGTPTNAWTGSNRGGWSSSEYDALWERFNTTLSRPDRTQTLVQMFKVISDELPAVQLYYNPSVRAYVAGLVGPVESEQYWANVHEWAWR